MKSNYIILLSLILLGGCSPESGGIQYSPLVKYTNFPITKVTGDEGIGQTMLVKSRFYSNYLPLLASHQGIISNTNYFMLEGSNVLWVNGGNITTNYTFTNTAEVVYFDANQIYVAYQKSAEIVVIGTNGVEVYRKTLSTNMAAVLGKENSSLLAYAYKTNTNWEDLHILKLVNLANQQEINLPFAYDIVGFSPKNRYLFYNIYSGNYYLYNYEAQRIHPSGPLACYDLLANSNIVLGIMTYESNTTVKWSDTITGIREDLKGFYLTELTTAFESGHTLIDGRRYYDINGLWQVDISSLGLSEWRFYHLQAAAWDIRVVAAALCHPWRGESSARWV